MTESALPTKWDEELDKHARAAAAVERPSLTNISVRGGFMRLNGVEVPNSELPCVVVASVFENQYYDPDKPFDPDNLQNPICFAQSLTGEDMVPHEASVSKQSDSCETCPQMQWKSDPVRKKGKACKEKRKLALIPASQFKDDATVKKAEMALLAIPVTSIKFWGNYVNMLLNDYQRPPFAVLTKISSKPDPKTQLRVEFECIGRVSDEFLGPVMERIGPAQAVLMQPYEGTPEDPTKSKEENAEKKKKKY